MNNKYRLLGYVMAANFEAIGLFVGASLIADWLDKEYPRQWPWSQVTILVAIVLLVISWSKMMMLLMKRSRETSHSESND